MRLSLEALEPRGELHGIEVLDRCGTWAYMNHVAVDVNVDWLLVLANELENIVEGVPQLFRLYPWRPILHREAEPGDEQRQLAQHLGGRGEIEYDRAVLANVYGLSGGTRRFR